MTSEAWRFDRRRHAPALNVRRKEDVMNRAQYNDARAAIRPEAHLRRLRYDDSKRHDRTRVYHSTLEACELWRKRVDLVVRTNYVHGRKWTLSQDRRVVLTHARYEDSDTKRTYRWTSRECFNSYTNNGLYELWVPVESDANCRHPVCSGYMLIMAGSGTRKRFWHNFTRPTLRAWRPEL